MCGNWNLQKGKRNMFGRKKRVADEEIKSALEEIKRGQAKPGEIYKKQAEAIHALQKEISGYGEKLDGWLKDGSRQLKRHSDAVEDLLDEGRAQEALSAQYEKQLKEYKSREDALLSLICRYQDAFFIIEDKLKAADNQAGGEWAAQLALFRKMFEKEFRQCAIEETGTKGEMVDYKYHEILDAVDTTDEKLDNTVACVYKPGIIYHGKVASKAQIGAYRVRRDKI